MVVVWVVLEAAFVVGGVVEAVMAVVEGEEAAVVSEGEDVMAGEGC